jgi:hypothetical protein
MPNKCGVYKAQRVVGPYATPKKCEDTEIYLFFSDQLSAHELRSADWCDYQPAVISLDDFSKNSSQLCMTMKV